MAPPVHGHAFLLALVVQFVLGGTAASARPPSIANQEVRSVAAEAAEAIGRLIDWPRACDFTSIVSLARAAASRHLASPEDEDQPDAVESALQSIRDEESAAFAGMFASQDFEFLVAALARDAEGRDVRADASQPEVRSVIAASVAENHNLARALVEFVAKATESERRLVATLRELATGVDVRKDTSPSATRSRFDAAWHADLRARHLSAADQNQGLVGTALDLEAFCWECPGCEPAVRDAFVAALDRSRHPESPTVASLRATLSAWGTEFGLRLADRAATSRARRIDRLIGSGEAGRCTRMDARRTAQETAEILAMFRRDADDQMLNERYVALLAQLLASDCGIDAAHGFIVAFRRAAMPRVFDRDQADVAFRSAVAGDLTPEQSRSVLEARADALRNEASIGRLLIDAAWDEVARCGFPLIADDASEATTPFQQRYVQLKGELDLAATLTVARIRLAAGLAVGPASGCGRRNEMNRQVDAARRVP